MHGNGDFTATNLPRFATIAVLRALRVISWMILAITVYFTMLWLALEFRVIVFDNLCIPQLQHDLEAERVDWCETWWWHPFRLSTRLIFGGIAAWIVMSVARIMLSKEHRCLVRAAVFMVCVAALHTYYFSLVALMRDTTSTACLYGWYGEDSTQVNCSQLLGPFGDLRFYYPATVAVISLAMAIRQRKLIDSTRKHTANQEG